MAKKGVGIYMRAEDLAWMDRYPVVDTMSGRVNFFAEWATRQAQRGMVTALGKLDKDERLVIIHYVASLIITPDFSPAMLAMGIADSMRYDGAGYWLEGERRSALVAKCGELSPAEVIGLLAWARGYWAQEGRADACSLDEYAEEGTK